MECLVISQRFHRGFTAAEKTELWDRWQRGESLKAIGRAFSKPSSSIYCQVAPHGGIRPAPRRRSSLIDDGDRHTVFITIWESDTDTKVYWISLDENLPRTTIIHGTAVQ